MKTVSEGALERAPTCLITQISTSVHSANEMVNDLLDLARCDLGNGIPVQPENTDLSGLLLSSRRAHHRPPRIEKRV